MNSVFLIGGGWRGETFAQTYGRFLSVAVRNGQRRVAIVVAEEDGLDSEAQFSRFFKAFATVGLKPDEAQEVFVSRQKPLTADILSRLEPTGIFVAGGLTPQYYESLCTDRSWIEHLAECEIPYAGFSAGAAIAAEEAIIGGWRRETAAGTVDVTNENAGEDLELLDVRRGLGLVPFAVDVHATQWGNLARLLHAVDAGLAATGWAIDENTMLEIRDGAPLVYGSGNAYFVQRSSGSISVEIRTQEK